MSDSKQLEQRSPYRYALLNPAETREAERANSVHLGVLTLGIEVTLPRLAARCGLGNIDPQHGARARDGAVAAIEACLDASLPPPGAVLVTIRPDLDALGGMALLTLRATACSAISRARPLLDRVARVGRADSFNMGHWPGPRPMPTSFEDLLDDGLGREIAVLSAAVADRKVPLEARVRAAGRWLVRGRLPSAHLEAAKIRATRLVESLCAGETTVQILHQGRLAVVQSQTLGAHLLGYRAAPVIVLLNREHPFGDGRRGRKLTIAQFCSGHADLDAVAEALRAREPGWGGQRNIIGSPLAGPSALELEEVVEIVASHLEN